MRIKEIKIYQFNELSDNAKEKAREWYRRGALDHEWWDAIYEDAARCKLTITSFDCDHGTIKGKTPGDGLDVARAILKEHGEDCETYKLASIFIETVEPLQTQLDALESDDDSLSSDIHKLDNEIAECESEFIHDILEEYLGMLRREVEYILSDEQTDEMILANEYEFTEDGSIH